MFQEFWASLPLFYDTYFASLSLAVLLSILGIFVVTREQVFLTAAVSQAATLGLAVNVLWNLGMPLIAALVFSILAALTSVKRKTRGGHSPEETTAWVFLISSSLSVLLLANHPQGAKQIQSVLASSIIGTSSTEVILFSAMALITIVICLFMHRKFALFISDPIMAAAIGIPIVLWQWGLALVLGFSLGLAVCSTGMLFAFGCTVLPAQIAKSLCRRISSMFVVAPIVAAVCVVFGLILANHLNYPPGQMIVTSMAITVVFSWAVANLRDRMLS